MDTLHQPSVSDTDPLPGTIPYFRRELDQAAADRGLPPEPWAA
jgi:hypothetical protein